MAFLRCGSVRFKKSGILRCGLVRFSDAVNPSAWFGAVIYPTVRFGVVLKYRKCDASVRCGFQMLSGTLRCGSVIFEILR